MAKHRLEIQRTETLDVFPYLLEMGVYNSEKHSNGIGTAFGGLTGFLLRKF
jgi:hypothetical protein